MRGDLARIGVEVEHAAHALDELHQPGAPGEMQTHEQRGGALDRLDGNHAVRTVDRYRALVPPVAHSFDTGRHARGHEVEQRQPVERWPIWQADGQRRAACWYDGAALAQR